jgi:DNA polymerase-2
MAEAWGFIVSAWDEFRPGNDRMLFTGRLEDGRSFAALRASPGPALFVARDRGAEASVAIGIDEAFVEDWCDMAGVALARLCLPAGDSLRSAERSLAAAGIAVTGLDRRRADEELAAHGIRGPVLIRGEERPGRRVDVVFVEPSFESGPSGFRPDLRWLALDIETDSDEGVVAVSLAEKGKQGEVLFVQGRGRTPRAPGIEVFPDESSLLGALAGRIVRRDPDVVTGWNVIDFDLRVLIVRCEALGITFDAGRTDAPATFAERSNANPRSAYPRGAYPRGGRAGLDLPGRAVIDAMRLVRGSGARYEDLSLETVARETLGEGKSISSRGEEKVEELDLLRARDPDAFCAYCLRDSELVLRILDRTGLDELTARRASLTGVSLDLAWTSIPAFERVYGSELRARRVAIPTRSDRRVSGAAGGTVLEASAGMFPRVLVFDFRSLYPSIMRTFNIDPLAYARAAGRTSATGSIASATDIVAPNGARFDSSPGVMPGLIAEYSGEREMAIAEGDEVAAYVYKILQNSFYGVLGAEGCRYARTEIAGAITSFGKKFLVMARDFFEAKGRRVLYGDTDSVFVLSGAPEGALYDELMAMGRADADELNGEIARRVESEYGLESLLRIRCEKAYATFLIPRLKSDKLGHLAEAGEGGRGRSKGYAGLLLAPDGSSDIEVKGMEAARSDFTPLARDFQIQLLGLVFSGAGEAALRDFCRAEEAALRRGERDDKLVYRRTLRRLADDYDSETPQVRAARLMGWTARRGRVSYVMTGAGAEPIGSRSGAALDYDHYVAHQLLPIAASIADAVGLDAWAWLAEGSQFELDFSN